MNRDIFYLRIDMAVRGPLTNAAVQKLIKAGKLKPTDEISRKECGPWTQLQAAFPSRPRIPVASGFSLKISSGKSPEINVLCDCPVCTEALTLTEAEVSGPVLCPACRRHFGVTPAAAAAIRKEHENAAIRREHVKEQELTRELEKLARQNQRRQQLEKTAAILKGSTDGVGALAGAARGFLARAIAEAQQELDNAELLSVGDSLTIGRDSKHSDWIVHDPAVSRRHCMISRDKSTGCFAIRDSRSRTGTHVNSVKLASGGTAQLKVGDLIRIGPAELEVVSSGLKVRSRSGHAHLQGLRISRTVIGSTGASISLLNDVTLDIVPGTFAVIIGPSGSGKSTLLNALSGRLPATSGRVLLNGEDLYRNFSALKSRMTTVPQKDLLHDTLTLKQVLTYTASLRLPKDLSTAEKQEAVNQVLNEVEMTGRHSTPIRTFSGGQIKRASLANELLSNPSMLFVDEATSGLDEHSDRDIMQMFQKLASSGKTILCVTHNLGNVCAFANVVIVMATGGFLAFAGSPQEALEWFQVSSLSEIYVRLKEKPSETWASEFKASELGSYISAVARPQDSAVASVAIERSVPTVFQQVGQAIRHGTVIFTRCFELLRLSRGTLAVTAMQPLCVAGLLYVVFGALPAGADGGAPLVEVLDIFAPTGRSAVAGKLLFLIGLSSFWFGCNNSSKELVKERELFERERLAGLSPVGYLCAKGVYVGVLTAGQIICLSFLVSFLTGLSLGFLGASYLPCLLLAGLAGTGLGLLISSCATDNDMAATAVPLAIIPQVILSGGLTPLAGFAEGLAAVVSPTYWSYGALTGTLYRRFGVWKTWQETEFVMYSQEHVVVANLILVGFSVALFTACGLRLTGRLAWPGNATPTSK